MATFHVGTPVYSLVLAQVIPGFDSEVAHALAIHPAGERTDEHGPDVTRYIYFAFSEYDLLAIVPLTRERHLDRLTTFGHRYVRDLQQILCFPWTQGSAHLQPLQPKSALTLTFLKLDEELVREGIPAEHDAVRWLQQRIREEQRAGGVDGLVLSSLGWPELLLVLTGNDLRALLTITRDLAVTPVERGDKSPLRFTFSHTLPCVRWDGTASHFSTEPVDGSVSCHIMVSARPEHLGHLIQRVSGFPANVAHPPSTEDVSETTVPQWEAEVAFGRRDVLITPRNRRPVSIDSIVQLLSMLRSSEMSRRTDNSGTSQPDEPGPLVTATHTQISIDMPQTGVDQADHQGRLRQLSKRIVQHIRPDWAITRLLTQFGLRRRSGEATAGETTAQADTEPLDWALDAIDQFESWERRLRNPGLAHAGRLRQMLFRYQAIQGIPELEGIVDDMTEVLVRSIEDALYLAVGTPLPPIPIVTPSVRESYEEYEEIANLFFYALDQRLAGAVFGVSDPARAYTHLHALGIQRILCAADAIPRALLRLVQTYEGRPLKWLGFVVFGYRDETAKLVFNVLNMPYQDVAAPSEWWRLAHEAGHACVDLQSFSDLPGFRAMEQQLKHSDFEDLAANPTHLLDELAANVFEFEFAFGGQFDLYLRTVWRFFNWNLEGQEKEGKLRELLLRATFVFLYDLERRDILQPGQTAISAIEEGKDEPTVPEDKPMDRSRSLRALGEYGSLEALIETEITERVLEAAPKLRHGIRRVPVEDVAKRYCECESWRTELVDLFDDLRFTDTRLSDVERRLEEHRKSLEAGQVLTDLSEQDLFLLSLALQSGQQALYDRQDNRQASDAVPVVPLRARIACILSLWHWGRKQTNRHP